MSDSLKHPEIPRAFKAAVFPAPGAPLEVIEVEYRKPGPHKLAVQVEAVVLSDLDAVSELGLLRVYAKFPRTPGTAFAGTIVECGSGAREGGAAGGSLSGPISSLVRRISRFGLGRSGEGDKDKDDAQVEERHVWKVGERVIVSSTHQGCGEYASAHANAACPVPSDMPLLESIVTATFGAKISLAQQAHEHYCHHMQDDEAALLRERNEREGFGQGKGAVCVFGQGGYASLAYHALRNEVKSARLLLVTTSETHTHDDYNMPKENFMRGQLGSGLLDKFAPHGGIRHLICVDMPRREYGFDHLLDAMRHGGQITLLSIQRDNILQIPPANIVARSLVVRGAPDLHSADMVAALKQCHRHELHRHVSLRQHPFTEEGLREAYGRVKDGKDSWEAQVVCFKHEIKTVPAA